MGMSEDTKTPESNIKKQQDTPQKANHTSPEIQIDPKKSSKSPNPDQSPKKENIKTFMYKRPKLNIPLTRQEIEHETLPLILTHQHDSLKNQENREKQND